MDFFEDLAAEVHAMWLRHRRDDRAFPEVAQSALEKFAPASAIKPDELFHWLIATDHIPIQFDPRSTFGDFAITVATGDDFHIDVLVWTDSTTAIHQHSFSGAFHVLHGSSLHTLWSFEESRRWNDRLKSGRLDVRATEWLDTGTTRPILPGAAMVHSLFHLESPSVTVVVRTPSSAEQSPQLTYERSGLAYDNQIAFPRTEKIRQLLSTLWASGHPERRAMSAAAIAAVDDLSAVRVILLLPPTVPSAAQSELIEVLARRDPQLAGLLCDTVAKKQRDRVLGSLRQRTKSARHRLLLALALNLPNRSLIDSVLCQIAPHESAESWLWDTIRSTQERGGVRQDGASLLGFTLNEINEAAVQLLLDGRSVGEAAEVLADGHQELVGDALALCATLSELPILRPLCRLQTAAV